MFMSRMPEPLLIVWLIVAVVLLFLLVLGAIWWRA
jgi:hypothetical protein